MPALPSLSNTYPSAQSTAWPSTGKVKCQERAPPSTLPINPSDALSTGKSSGLSLLGEGMVIGSLRPRPALLGPSACTLPPQPLAQQ